jgi:hypothetical protein
MGHISHISKNLASFCSKFREAIWCVQIHIVKPRLDTIFEFRLRPRPVTLHFFNFQTNILLTAIALFVAQLWKSNSFLIPVLPLLARRTRASHFIFLWSSVSHLLNRDSHLGEIIYIFQIIVKSIWFNPCNLAQWLVYDNFWTIFDILDIFGSTYMALDFVLPL